MREFKPSLTVELTSHVGKVPVWRAPAFPVFGFRELVEHTARLSYANPDVLLFYRGQTKDYQSKAGGSTLYPPIYREDALSARDLQQRFRRLDDAAREIVSRFKTAGIEGHRELRQKRYIQWSILQHYEVVATPLLDLTQSLRVACSFAQMNATDQSCFVYVIGLPYLTNRISINSEHDIVNIRLLSICPPTALRPFFQEGYLAGTADVTVDFESKTELDFRNRLIAKFEIPANDAFWGEGFERIPQSAIYPENDVINELCSDLRDASQADFIEGDLGSFVREWALLERQLLETAREYTERNVSVREAISALSTRGLLTEEQTRELNSLRRLRNEAVHAPTPKIESLIGRATAQIQTLHQSLHLPPLPRLSAP